VASRTGSRLVIEASGAGREHTKHTKAEIAKDGRSTASHF
jgi:hypothetical protein